MWSVVCLCVFLKCQAATLCARNVSIGMLYCLYIFVMSSLECP